MSNFLEIATAMAQRGVAVTPTYAGLRFPALEGWTSADGWFAATTDVDQIARWAEQDPNYNCCCVGKRDGVYMLDIDDVEAARRRGMPELPPTFTVDTPGGGEHKYLIHNALSRTLGNANVYDGEGTDKKKIVEVKGHNTAVCAPNCVREDGKKYVVRDENAAFAEMTFEFYEWVVREGTVKQVHASKTGGERKYHPDFERDDLHAHFDWEFADDEPFVQSDGAEYLTFNTCPVCDRELNAEDIKGRKCCLIYGKYGVSFNCVWCGESTRWEELMEAMEEKGYERYPEPIFLDQDIELMLSNPAFPVDTDDLPETKKTAGIAEFTKIFPNAIVAEELNEVVNRLPDQESREGVLKAWKMAAEQLVEVRKGVETVKDDKGKEKVVKKFRHVVDDEILNYIHNILKNVMDAKYFVDAYPYIFLPLENTVYKFHSSEDAYRLLSRFGLRLTQRDYDLAQANLHDEILMYGTKTHIEKFGCMRGEAIYINNGRRRHNQGDPGQLRRGTERD